MTDSKFAKNGLFFIYISSNNLLEQNNK